MSKFQVGNTLPIEMIPKLYHKVLFQLIVILIVFICLLYQLGFDSEFVSDEKDAFYGNGKEQILQMDYSKNKIVLKPAKVPEVIINQTHVDNCKLHYESSPVIDIKDVNQYIPELRIYNHCHFNLKAKTCDRKLENKMYPWLNQLGSPVLSRVNTDNVKFISKPLFKSSSDKCILDRFKESLKGKGIVVGATESHFKDLLSLIMVLRKLDTELPLQIVHKGDLSESSIKMLTKLANADFRKFEEDPLVVKLFQKQEKNGVTVLKSLDLEFVDISNMINEEYKAKLERFSNKLLAYLFNTFEEVILLDVDAVSFVEMKTYFEFPEYIKRGAYFFKDRELHAKHDSNKNTVEMFTKLLPKSSEFDQFGIRPSTNYTLENRFFQGYSNLMESGLLIVNRKTHFDNALMVVSLALFDEVLDNLYGGKELYWLGMSISGDENYNINRKFAGAIGELTHRNRSHFPKNPFVREICSNHLAHLYSDLLTDEMSLLWMSTGFKYCNKLMSYNADNPFFKGWTPEKVHDFNENYPLKIRAVIIPPNPKLTDDTANREFTVLEPLRGWLAKEYCEAYTVCGYDFVDGEDGDTLLFEKEEEYRQFDELGMIWLNSMELLDIVHKNKNK